MYDDMSIFIYKYRSRSEMGRKCRIKYWLLLYICMITVVGVKAEQTEPEPHPDPSKNSTQVILQSRSDCSASKNLHEIGNGVNRYDVKLKWSRYNCSSSEKGFLCSQIFKIKDNFETLGTRLCVDLQGVQKDIKEMNQLFVIVKDRGGELKRVYINTQLKPENSPYYVCTHANRNWISISMNVRSSVTMCPQVLDYLFSNDIRMGSVVALPLYPIAKVNLAECTHDKYISLNNSYLIKMNTQDAQEECKIAIRFPVPYAYTRGCLKLSEFSNDFDCDVIVRLASERASSSNDMTLSTDTGYDDQKCDTFAARNGYPILYIWNSNHYRISSCRGQFAFHLDFRQVPPPDSNNDDSDESGQSPNLYMAVFITLIAICLVCLALTCLCCVRFRAKRLRRLQQSSRQGSVPNQGFQSDFPNTPPYDPNIIWSQTQPTMLHGLPSYEDLMGEQSGVNPADDSFKNDLPPPYESVCSTSET